MEGGVDVNKGHMVYIQVRFLEKLTLLLIDHLKPFKIKSLRAHCCLFQQFRDCAAQSQDCAQHVQQSWLRKCSEFLTTLQSTTGLMKSTISEILMLRALLNK